MGVRCLADAPTGVLALPFSASHQERAKHAGSVLEYVESDCEVTLRSSGFKANKDGKDDLAVALLRSRAYLGLSSRLAAESLKEEDVKRSRDWVQSKRRELNLGKGVSRESD